MKVPDPELEAFASDRYAKMKYRLRARYDNQGRCYQAAVPLPFSRVEFSNWVAGVFRSQGMTKCFYCEWPISLETTQLDHRTPLGQGGSPELWNLVPTCEACNQLKGEVSEDGFRLLKQFLAGDTQLEAPLNPIDAQNIRGRLQSQLKLAKWKQRRLKQEAAQQAVRIVPHQREA